MKIFKMFEKKPERPHCLHEWHLIDFELREFYGGQDVDFVEIYTVACSKCQLTKKMDSYQYNLFSKILGVKKAEGGKSNG